MRSDNKNRRSGYGKQAPRPPFVGGVGYRQELRILRLKGTWPDTFTTQYGTARGKHSQGEAAALLRPLRPQNVFRRRLPSKINTHQSGSPNPTSIRIEQVCRSEANRLPSSCW